MGKNTTKVLVVEDDPFVKSLLVSVLESSGFETKAAGSAAEARKLAEGYSADAAVLDVELGDGPSGFDLAQVLRVKNPNLGLIFLTHIPEPRVVGIENKRIPRDAAYLRKDRLADSEILARAIDAALRNRVSKDFRDDKNAPHKLTEVSRSQLEVLRMVAMGLSNHEIASQRGTTVRAVEHLIKRAFAAAGVDSESPGNTRVIAAREFIQVAGMPNGR